MIGFARHKLSALQVVDTGRLIKVAGINYHALMKDIANHWETSTLEKYMFKRINGYAFQISHFFALDLLYMLEVLKDDRANSRVPKRTLFALVSLLKTKTWLSRIEVGTKTVVNMDKIKNLFPFEYKDYQVKFIEHYGKAVPAYNLKGYLLDAGAGTGKTATNLALAEALEVNKVIVVALKNSVDEVWRHTIDDLMKGNKTKAWVSSDNKPIDINCKHFVVHYEYLGKFLEQVKELQRHFKNTLVVVDESHNFNRPESQRTEQLVELCRLPMVEYINFASGTPIMAVGYEAIPFLRIVDPYFDSNTEERFRRIYGRSARKANEILRNRIGHLKYHVPKQDVVKVEVIEEEYLVKLKNGEKYTLPNVSEQMSKFVEDRKNYYAQNKERYENDYYKALSLYEKKLKPADLKEYNEYQRNVATISKGFDARTMRDISMMCNRYERTKIIPALPSNMKASFRDAKSVVKYVDLKIMGEALGNVLGKLRTECNKDMVQSIEFDKLINAAEKKTLIFTSYVDVVEETDKILRAMEYEPLLVYGDTNKDLSKIVKSFYKNPDLNPMIATLQSLSTAVPITCANRVIYLNQPFRDALKIQSISRVARLGQDKPVTVINVMLDTGTVPNLSTRSNEIMEWSKEQVSQIVGNKNLDTETLSFEDSNDEALEDVVVRDVNFLTQEELDPITLYFYKVPNSNAKVVYSDSREVAVLEGLRDLSGENVQLDYSTLTYRGGDGLTAVHEGCKIPIYIIKPKESDEWIYKPNEDIHGDILYMEPLSDPACTSEDVIEVKVESLQIERIY